MGKKIGLQMQKFIAILYGKLFVAWTTSNIGGDPKHKKYTSNGKKNLTCKWMFFPILTFDIIEEIASGNRI